MPARKISSSGAALISEAHGNASPGPATGDPGATPRASGSLSNLRPKAEGLFSLTVQFERDATEAQADEAYRRVTQALKEQGVRFAAQLRIVPDQPEVEIRSAMSKLWTGGDFGG